MSAHLDQAKNAKHVIDDLSNHSLCQIVKAGIEALDLSRGSTFTCYGLLLIIIFITKNRLFFFYILYFIKYPTLFLSGLC